MLFWVILIADHLVGQELMHAENFLLRPDGIWLQASEWPVFFQILLGFLASDLVSYLLHRAGHVVPWLWRFHSVHHSDPILDVTTAGRSHPVELSLFVACKILLYQFLGLPMWVEGLRASLHNGVTMLQHANVTYPAWIEHLRPIFVTPAMHRLHHDDRRVVHDSNYGMVFSFWDRIFGTYIDPGEVEPGRVGLRGYDDDRWQTVRGMMLTPARRPPNP